ncbi:MAG: dolichyl-phosphate beta-D-mannosyltransferase [Candidatus Taylorbacteria bacterium]|nr:dolichyl-phosphate beta-D-mannosyltransferase [Candidatus Taylorbacteria bacterium]
MLDQNTISDDLKVTLVIPAYNEEKYIGKCLQAVIDSGAKFCEIIVIDNASKDRTGEIARGFMEYGVRVVREEKKGLTQARQRGYLEAKGDIIANIDSDALLPKGWYEWVISVFSKRGDVVCVSGPYFYYDISSAKQFFVKYFYWYLCAMPMYFLIGYMVTGSNFAIRRSTLDKMNGFDTSIAFYGEDTNIARRASKFGKVLFSFKHSMPTSGRRFVAHGFCKTGYLYLKNFLSEVFFRKPATTDYIDIN